MMVEWRNPRALPDGKIDVEIDHPEFGWIPYTADANDPFDILLRLGQEASLHAVILASGQAIAEADPPPPPAPRTAPKLALIRAMRLLTLEGELAPEVDPGGSVWPLVKALIDEASPAVREDWAAATEVPRNDPVMLSVIALLPWPDEIDAEAVIDAAYILARRIARGEIDPYTGQPTAE